MRGALRIECREVDELAAAYALGALDPGEERAVSAHLDSCGRPHTEARAMLDGAAVLQASVEPVAPPPALRDRLMATVAATPQDHAVPAGPMTGPSYEPARTAQRPWWQLRPVSSALAAAGLVAAIGLGAWGVTLNRELAERDAALRAVAAADAIHAATGEAGTGWVIEQGEQAMFMADGLADLPAGRLYELWLIDDSGTASAVGTLTDTSDIALVELESGLANATTFAVTVEAERVEAPTSEPVLVASLEG